jgi:hypothetical protein
MSYRDGWEDVHAFIVQWVEQGDDNAGLIVRDLLRHQIIVVETTDEGLFLKPGPYWPGR